MMQVVRALQLRVVPAVEAAARDAVYSRLWASHRKGWVGVGVGGERPVG